MRRASGLIFTIATLSAMNAALADDPLGRARAATEQALSRAPVGASYCFPPVTLPAKAHVVHVYRGAAPVDPTKTARPPRYVDVKVEKTAEPVLLTLSAYEPVVWRLAVADDAAIAGVHLLGYYEPLVEGAPAGAPVGREFYKTRSGERAPQCVFPTRPAAQSEASAARGQAKAETKREAVMREFFQDDAEPPSPPKVDRPAGLAAYAARVAQWGIDGVAESWVMNQPDPYAPIVISDASAQDYQARRDQAEAMRDAMVAPTFPLLPPDAPRRAPPEDEIGADGLAYLMDAGYLAPGDAAADFARLKAQADSIAADGDDDDDEEYFRDSYVILGPIVYPSGLCGAHRVRFFLPKGVAEPRGSRCHSALVRL